MHGIAIFHNIHGWSSTCINFSVLFGVLCFNSVIAINESSSNKILAQFMINRENRHLTSNVYDSVRSYTAEECCLLCVQDVQCVSVSYSDALNLCLKSTSIEGFEETSGWNVYELSQFSGNTSGYVPLSLNVFSLTRLQRANCQTTVIVRCPSVR